MAKEDDSIEFSGKVIDVLAGSNFRVQVINPDGSEGHTVLCYLGGKIRQNSIKIVLGDMVVILVSAYDPSRGRIVFRNK